MTPDPNADLIGYRFPTDKGEAVVLGTPVAYHESGSYVEIKCDDGSFTLRPAANVRRTKGAA